MHFRELFKNKIVLYGSIGAVVLILLLLIIFNPFRGNSGSPDDRTLNEEFNLLTTDNLGKAIEIQALLSRQGIEAKRREDGSKSKLYLEKGTKFKQRDEALLAVVQSGLMDEHTGLEIFDKGDFTSTKDDKRIRLARAINGELARLIRKIPPIENAEVFVSIPEPTIFTSMKKPTTATVQLSIPSGDRLDKEKIRAITNLLLGSVQGLEASNISITDTNGNVYSSIISAEDNMMDAVEENDQYMKSKVMVSARSSAWKRQLCRDSKYIFKTNSCRNQRIHYTTQDKNLFSMLRNFLKILVIKPATKEKGFQRSALIYQAAWDKVQILLQTEITQDQQKNFSMESAKLKYQKKKDRAVLRKYQLRLLSIRVHFLRERLYSN